MESKTFVAPEISCGHCVKTIQREIGELDGVRSVEGDERTKQVTVQWEVPASWQLIRATLTEIGYPPKE